MKQENKEMKSEYESKLVGVTADFKRKGYDFFKKYINEVYSFPEKADGKDIEFEIHVKDSRNRNKELFVMVEASQKKWFMHVGKAIYFAISEDNSTRDLKIGEAF